MRTVCTLHTVNGIVCLCVCALSTHFSISFTMVLCLDTHTHFYLSICLYLQEWVVVWEEAEHSTQAGGWWPRRWCWIVLL